MQYISRIEEVSVTATKEFALEETLQRMQSEWNDICFEFLPYRDSDVSVLTWIEEIQGDQF
jgi:dynein heavy chain